CSSYREACRGAAFSASAGEHLACSAAGCCHAETRTRAGHSGAVSTGARDRSLDYFKCLASPGLGYAHFFTQNCAPRACPESECDTAEQTPVGGGRGFAEGDLCTSHGGFRWKRAERRGDCVE